MPRPVTLFTGQWADLTFDTICAKAKSFGYDGVEIACWGDHFEVDKVLSDDGYIRSRQDILEKYSPRGRKTWSQRCPRLYWLLHLGLSLFLPTQCRGFRGERLSTFCRDVE